MSDLRNEIPQFAFINAQILQHAESTNDFKNCINHIESFYGLTSYNFMNPAYVVSLLYCLIVIPKEIWLASNHPIYGKIDNPEKFFNIDLNEIIIKEKDNFRENETCAFIRHLRNAIAHVHFSVDENMNFKFWDHLPNKHELKDRNFGASASPDKLMDFLSKVGALLANLRNQESHT